MHYLTWFMRDHHRNNVCLCLLRRWNPHFRFNYIKVEKFRWYSFAIKYTENWFRSFNKLPEKALEIINSYHNNVSKKESYVFPFLTDMRCFFSYKTAYSYFIYHSLYEYWLRRDCRRSKNRKTYPFPYFTSYLGYTGT